MLQRIDTLLAGRLLRDFPLEAARLLEKFPAVEACSLLSDSDDSTVGEVIRLMDRRAAAACLLAWPGERTGALIALLGPDSASLLLRALSHEDLQSVLSRCDEQTAAPVRRILRYPEESAGALMDPNAAAVCTDFSAAETLKLLQKSASSVTSYVYVTNRQDMLKGVVGIRELFAAPPKIPMEQIMHSPVLSIPAQADRAAILSHPGWRRHHALPVTGHGDVLIGVISHRIFRDLAKEDVISEDRAPLLLSIAEMYWIVMMRLTESLAGFLGNKNRQKEGIR